MNFTIRVNGERRQLDVDPEMPLLWVLRELSASVRDGRWMELLS